MNLAVFLVLYMYLFVQSSKPEVVAAEDAVGNTLEVTTSENFTENTTGTSKEFVVSIEETNETATSFENTTETNGDYESFEADDYDDTATSEDTEEHETYEEFRTKPLDDMLEIDQKSPKWPRLLLAQTSQPNKFLQGVKAIVHSFDPNEYSDVNYVDRPSMPPDLSITGNDGNGYVCYSIFAKPFFECLSGGSTWKPIPYDNSPTLLKFPVKLDLSPTSDRILYLDPTGGLQMVFLDFEGDRAQLLRPVQDFTIDWYDGVLFTIDQDQTLVLWTFEDGEDILRERLNVTSVELESKYLITNGKLPEMSSDIQFKVLYLKGKDGNVGYIDYKNITVLTLQSFNYTFDWRFAKSPFLAHGNFLYWHHPIILNRGLDSGDYQIRRLNIETLKIGIAPQNISFWNEGFKYTRMVLWDWNIQYYLFREHFEICSKCSHRCFPKYPRDVACRCPIGSIDAHGSTCVSNNTLAVALTSSEKDEESHAERSLRLINYVTKNYTEVRLENVSAEKLIPQSLVPFWSPFEPWRFCVLSSTGSSFNESFAITCHWFSEPSKSVIEVPWTSPMDFVKVTSVTQLHDQKWVVTWLDNSGSIRYSVSTPETPRTLPFTHCNLKSLFSEEINPDYIVVDGFRFTIGYYAASAQSLYFDDPGILGREGLKRRWSVMMEPFRNSLQISAFFLSYFNQEGRFIGNLESQENQVQRFNGFKELYKIPVARTSPSFLSRRSANSEGNCWIEYRASTSYHSAETVDQYIKCHLTAELNNFVVYESKVGISQMAVFDMTPASSLQNLTQQESEVCEKDQNCSHLCRKTLLGSPICLCPHELPILLNERDCSLRMTVQVSNGTTTSAWKLTEQGAELLFRSEASTPVQYVLDPQTRQVCRLVEEPVDGVGGVVCSDGRPLPGSGEAKYLIRGHSSSFFPHEVYWMSKDGCIFVGAVNSKTLGFGCYKMDLESGNHLTVDPQRKILFWLEMYSDSGFFKVLSRRLGHTSNLVSSATLNMYSMEQEQHQKNQLEAAIFCNEAIRRVFVLLISKQHSTLYILTYREVDERQFDIWLLTSNTFFNGYLSTVFSPITNFAFFVQKNSDMLWLHSKNGDQFQSLFPLKNVIPEGQFNNITYIQSTYTAIDLELTSPCFVGECVYFCKVVETGNGSASQCLCPKDETLEVSDAIICRPPDSSSIEPWVLPVSISIGGLCAVALVAVILGCWYARKRERRRLERIIRDFMEGDVERAGASKNEAEKAQYLPFKAIIAPQDLVVNERKLLGEGHFGTVYEGLYSSKPVAVKTTKANMDAQVMQDFLRELKIMEFVGDHENIVKFFGAEISKIDEGRVLVVLELCPHGNLLDYLREFGMSPEEKRKSSAYVHVSESVAPVDVDDVGYKSHSFLAGKKSNLAPASSKMKRADNLELFVYKTFTDETANSNNPYSAFDVKSLPQAASKGTESLNSHYCAFNFNSLLQKSPAEPEDSGTQVLPKVCFHWARQIAAGLEYLESKHVVHGDMAARNVLVFDNDVVKVSDFGFSRKVYQYQIYQKKEACELPMRWAAPETIARREFSSKADVWSFGVTMWEIFTFGDVPFCYFEVDDEFYDKIIDGRVWLKRPKLLPEELYEQLLLPCWQLEPKQRPSFASIKTALDGVHDTLLDG